jgi:nitrite reductase/ring-hydroxylating ferredoxin subunit
VTGAADYASTDGMARVRATLHSTVMVVALVVLAVSLGLRAGNPADRTLPVVLGLVGALLVAAGAYVGGEVVFVLGNMVSRHAFRGSGTKWVRLDTGDLVDLAGIPEATPTRARAGSNDLVVVRVGSAIHAMHAVCAHAGGPLAEGDVVDGCLECPWHASRFRLTDGHVLHGPAVYDQPVYEIRQTDGGGYEVRRTPG